MVNDWRSSHFYYEQSSSNASGRLPPFVQFRLFECLLLHALVPRLEESNLSSALRNVYSSIELPALLALTRYELAGLRTLAHYKLSESAEIQYSTLHLLYFLHLL